MLTELHIEQLGVIDRLELVFGPGLTVFTGETGAGKTMIVEAISLLVGERAESHLVRPGAGEARVEGRFVVGDDETVMARVIPADGRSRAYLDGRLATVGALSGAGAALVDLHGQHAHQTLLSPAAQRDALDRFGRIDLAPLREARALLAEIDAGLAALGGDARARAREIDLLRFQVRELDEAALEPGEDEKLADEEAVLADALALREAAFTATEALSGEGGSLDALGSAIAALGHRPAFQAESARFRALMDELSDATSELRDRAEGIEDDPARLADVRDRRNLIHELRRKYGETIDDVLAYHRDVADRLAELEGYEGRAARLEAQRRQAEAAVADAATRLRDARRAAAGPLAEAVTDHLRRLAMPKARVQVTVDGPAGDDVVFQLAANPGEPELPLAKIASGGELARAMLALRLVLTEAPETLVFDEVDAGIGGQAASAVGRALADLGRQHQVFVVTHLAQVAALADHQLVVAKHERDGRTIAGVTMVTGEERIGELARMLSGASDSAAAREHAADLLRQASGTSPNAA